MSLKQKKQHYFLALHNEQACDYLNNSNCYFDWVITSAFYAALHYVSSVIFPVRCTLEGKTKTADNISTYRILTRSEENKHKLMVKLVFGNCHGIGSSYKLLLDLSYSSRYETNFQAYLYADKAKRYLATIKAYCADVSLQNEVTAGV